MLNSRALDFACAVCVVLTAATVLNLTALRVREKHMGSAERVSSVPDALQQVRRDIGIDRNGSAMTLIFALRSDCPYCEISMAFYRRIIEGRDEHRSPVQLVVLRPRDDKRLDAQLIAEGIRADKVIGSDSIQSLIRGTPTLLLIDSEGRLKKSWEGRLSSYEEDQALKQIFAPSEPSGSEAVLR